MVEYVTLSAALVAACASVGVWLDVRQARRARAHNLNETIARLEQIAACLEAISRPSQRLRTSAQQPGDGVSALRERLAARGH